MERFKDINKEDRQLLFKMIFGAWRERAELNEIVFPNSRDKTSSMSGFVNKGKSSEDIEKALKVLLSVDRMAGMPDMAVFGKDKAAKGEFATDVMLFLKKAKEYLKSHSQLEASQTIICAAKTITSLVKDVNDKHIGFTEAQKSMSALWYGISALLESMECLPFSLLKDVSKPLHNAVFASSGYCRHEILTFRNAVLSHTVALWRHAILRPSAARESFKIFTELTGKRPSSEMISEFCGSFVESEHSTIRDEQPLAGLARCGKFAE